MKRSKINLIGGAVAALVFLVCSVAVYTVVSAKSEAKTALKRLEAATKVGVNSVEYRRLLVEAQLAVEDAHAPRYSLVVAHYKQAAQFWQLGIEKNGMICEADLKGGNIHQFLRELYGDTVPVIVQWGCVSTDAVLQGYWKKASKELAEL